MGVTNYIANMSNVATPLISSLTYVSTQATHICRHIYTHSHATHSDGEKKQSKTFNVVALEVYKHGSD